MFEKAVIPNLIWNPLQLKGRPRIKFGVTAIGKLSSAGSVTLLRQAQ